MQFEYDPERLIEEVKKRPGIWDFDHIEYRVKGNRVRMWDEVITELLQGNEVTKSEKRELEIQLQKKWKSMRDCFQKYILNPNRTRRPYIYWRQLNFLLKENTTTQTAEASSDSEESSKVIKRSKPWKPKVMLNLKKSQTSDDDDFNNYDNHESNLSNTTEVPIIQSKHVRTNNTMDEFAFASVSELPKDCEDPDKMFLLSLLPHLKTIPETIRLNVKMELMQVLQNANYSRDHKIM